MQQQIQLGEYRMRKIIIVFVIIMAAAMLYHFYDSIPVEKSLNISFISAQGNGIERTSVMKIKGKYHKNLFRPDTILYDIEIEGKKYRVFNAGTDYFSFNSDGFTSKLRGRPSGAFILETNAGKTISKGYIEIYRDCMKVRGVFNGEMFAGPVSSYDEAQKIINKR